MYHDKVSRLSYADTSLRVTVRSRHSTCLDDAITAANKASAVTDATDPTLFGRKLCAVFSAVLAAAQALGREIVVLEAERDADFTAAFATIAERQAGALLVGAFTSFADARHRRMIVELAARYKIPTMYPGPLFTSFGGLMSYSPDFIDTDRQLGFQYVGRLLKGAKPADLPIQQPTKFWLAINLKTGKELGLTIPPGVLAIADEVIE